MKLRAISKQPGSLLEFYAVEGGFSGIFMTLGKEDYYKFSYSFENSACINFGSSQVFCRR